MAFPHMTLPALAFVAAVSVAGTAWSAGGPDQRMPERPAMPTAAELAFADAPYGVDPMVTGPTSKKFKIQRQMSGCEIARWPDVPLSCYPQTR